MFWMVVNGFPSAVTCGMSGNGLSGRGGEMLFKISLCTHYPSFCPFRCWNQFLLVYPQSHCTTSSASATNSSSLSICLCPDESSMKQPPYFVTNLFNVGNQQPNNPFPSKRILGNTITTKCAMKHVISYRSPTKASVFVIAVECLQKIRCSGLFQSN